MTSGSSAVRQLLPRWLAAAVVVMGTLGTAALAAAEDKAPASRSLDPSPTVASSVATRRPLERRDVEAWLDGYMPYALQRGDIAGAVVVVVKDGQVLLKKGYGFADVATRRPVDPDSTAFRPGSVSKLITWTAVMQQVEEGRIDLDRDINDYLDFKIPSFSGQPITMRNLMTHTPGFEDSLDNLIVMDPRAAPSLETFVKHRVPARIYPPGQVPAYSNYGVALAGYIVQRLSGVPFADYVDRRILAPLGMKQSSFHQPLPEALRPHVSRGYQRASARAEAYEIAVGPAGNAASTGADMARFMIAHLRDGEYEGARILKEETARTMHDSSLVLVNPAVRHMALGFFRNDRNGHRIIGHDGDTWLFHSVLQLYPDDHVGLFLSVNSVGRDGGARALRTGLIDGFADRYFDRAVEPAGPRQFDAKADMALMKGSYENSERAGENFLSLLGIVSQARVEEDDDGHLLASPILGLDGEPKRFEEIAPFVWREIGGKNHLAAKVVNGKVVVWAEEKESPAFVYTPTPAWRDATWLAPALATSMAVLLLTVLAWPIDTYLKRRYGGGMPPASISPGASFRHVRIAAVATVGLLISWVALLAFMFATFNISSNLEPVILLLHLCSIVVFPLALLAGLWNLGQLLKAGSTRSGWFLHAWNILLIPAFSITLWTAIVCNLIGLERTF